MRAWLAGLALATSVASASAQMPTPQGWNAYYMDGTYKISYAYLVTNLKMAQSKGLTGRGVAVAVFDTGLDVSNPKFSPGTILQGWNIYGNNGSGAASVTRDTSWHGTFVAGIIAANRVMQYGATYGMAPDAKIMPVQIFNDNGAATFTDSQFYTAINYAMIGIQKTPIIDTNRVGVFNNSWNTNLTLKDINNDVNFIKNTYRMMLLGWYNASTRNILNVFAAGNYAKADPGYFATMPTVDPRLASTWITVVATDQNGNLASYSNACGIAAKYCMAAPGSSILGIYTNASGVRTLATGSGTSFSAPQVSAAATLIWQYFPYLKAWEVQQILFRSADKSGIYADTAKFGQGLLNLTRAFDPIGTLKVSTSGTVTGASSTLSGTYIAPSNALSRPLASALRGVPMMVLDEFNRGYQMDLGNAVGRTARDSRWGDQMSIFGAQETNQGGVTVLSGHSNGAPATFAYNSDRTGIISAYGHNVTPSLAFGPFANGSIRGGDLVLLNSVGVPYMNMAPDSTSVATSYQWGGGHVTRLGVFSNTWRADPLGLNSANLPRMAGATVEHTKRWSGAWLSASLGWVNETQTLLGSNSGGVLGLGTGSNTAFAGVNGGLDLARGWSAFAGANVGYTWSNGSMGNVITGVRHLTSGNAYMGLVKQGVVSESDRFGIVASLPLSLGYGQIRMRLPTERDFDGNVTFQDRSVNLRPSSMEWNAQAFYNTPVGKDQSFGFGLGARFNAPDLPAGRQEVIGMVRYKLQF